MGNLVDWILVIAMVSAALWTVMTARILRSAVGLALTSAVLSALMFRLNSPLAAVFELSVCAGLIPVIFISTIGLTQRLEPETLAARQQEKLRTYWLLPLLLVLAAGVILKAHLPGAFELAAPAAGVEEVRSVMWNTRHLDLIGQLGLLVAGAFAVVVLVKGKKRAA